MLIAHKIEIFPDARQIEYFNQAIGVRKFIWNSLVWEYKHKDENGDYTKYSKKTSRGIYAKLKESNDFLKLVSANVADSTIDQYDEAMKRYFKKVSGRVQFKKEVNSFSITDKRKFKIVGQHLFIEKLNKMPRSTNSIKMRGKLRFTGETRQLTISRKANRWFASILILTEDKYSTSKPSGSIGVDMGVKNIAILSDGTKYESNNKLRKSLKKLAKLQKDLAKKDKGSNRYKLAKQRVQKLHTRIYDQRNDLLNKVSCDITNRFKIVCIEDLKASNMVKNHKLALAISDASFWELRRQIEYKSNWKDGVVKVVSQWFPSTKKCSVCGAIKKMSLADRTYECDSCGASIDRDVNAGINIEQEGLRI